MYLHFNYKLRVSLKFFSFSIWGEIKKFLIISYFPFDRI